MRERVVVLREGEACVVCCGFGGRRLDLVAAQRSAAPKRTGGGAPVPQFQIERALGLEAGCLPDGSRNALARSNRNSQLLHSV